MATLEGEETKWEGREKVGGHRILNWEKKKKKRKETT